MNVFKLAWRNLWRNRRRTILTTSAVVMAVALSTFYTSMQYGTYDRMIENTVSFYSGYIQVHDTLYWESKSINDSYILDKSTQSEILSTANVAGIIRRLESFTLVSTGDNTRGCALIGIDPAAENALTNYARWIVSGEDITIDGDGLLLTSNVAKNLNVQLGDTLVLLSQGYHGSTAAGLFVLKGILKYPSPEMNNMGGFIGLQSAQNFFSAYDRLTSSIVQLSEEKKYHHTAHELSEILDSKLSVMTWEEMQPELVQMIQSDKAGAVVFKLIIYLVVGFGIFGTIIMMVQERHRENAIMVAIGMQKSRLELTLFIETILIGVVGLAIGFVLSMPLVWYLVGHPIPLPDSYSEAMESFGIEAAMFFSVKYTVFLRQILSIFFITLAVSLYPVLKVFHMDAIKQMRN